MTRHSYDIETTVIGGGVIGLSLGRELAGRGLDVAVLEKNPKPGQETSARHSGVIHAGMYYPTGSLKAKLCVAGRPMLYDYCSKHNVPYSRIGKLILAVEESETKDLEALYRRGLDNGVEGLELVGQKIVRQREPKVKAVAGLLSNQTGIVSSDDLMAALERDLIDQGCNLLVGQEVVDLEPVQDGWRVTINQLRGEPYQFTTRLIVNSSGLWARQVAQLTGLDDFSIHWCKGDYFWTGRKLVNGLVYPLPEKGLKGLGVHTTVDLNGRIRFGPDTTYVDGLDYGVDESKASGFAQAICRYLPDIKAEDLKPDTSGIRPKLVGEGDGWADFRISLDRPNLLTLAGMESPGLTSCLAIARYAANLVS